LERRGKVDKNTVGKSRNSECDGTERKRSLGKERVKWRR